MIHRRSTRTAQTVPHGVRGTNRAACVASGGLYVHLAKRGAKRNFSVGNRIHAATACNTNSRSTMFSVQRVEQVKKRFFVHRLYRTRDVFVFLFKRFVAAARFAQQCFQRRGEQRPHARGTVLPFVFDFFSRMPKVVQVQAKTAVIQKFDDFSHLWQKARLAVRSQTHDFVLVTVIWEAKILCQRLVESAK